MLFRYLIGLSYAIFILNIAEIFHISAANAITKTLLLLAGFAFLVGRQKNHMVIVYMTIITVLIFLLGALTDFPGFSWGILLGALNQYVIIYLLLAARPSAEDRDFLLAMTAWIPVMCSILGLAYQVAGLRTAFPLEYNTGEGRFGGTLNAAFLGGLAMSGTFAALRLAEFGRPRYYAMVAVNLGVLLMTKARGPLAIALLVSVFAFYFSRRRSISIKVAATCFGLILACAAIPLVYASYAARLESSGLSGRDIMWPWLLELSSHYPYFGIGFGHQFFSTPREVFIQFSSNAAHNDYLRLLVELGYFGVVAFYVLLTMAFASSRRLWGQGDYTSIAAYIGFLIISITDNALATPTHFLLFIAGSFAAFGPAGRNENQRAVSWTKSRRRMRGLRLPSETQPPVRGLAG